MTGLRSSVVSWRVDALMLTLRTLDRHNSPLSLQEKLFPSLGYWVVWIPHFWEFEAHCYRRGNNILKGDKYISFFEDLVTPVGG